MWISKNRWIKSQRHWQSEIDKLRAMVLSGKRGEWNASFLQPIGVSRIPGKEVIENNSRSTVMHLKAGAAYVFIRVQVTPKKLLIHTIQFDKRRNNLAETITEFPADDIMDMGYNYRIEESKKKI